MARITIERRDGVVVFTPDPLDIAAGLESVFWFNADGTPHSMAPGAGSPDKWVVGDVNPNHSSSQVNFTTVGDHQYRCTLHDGESGTVHVQ